ncbi:uncharacterized protein F4807DRAFT_461036 [Annulohypoxylon truncatum]|uniref:uncharacterized protein n=1 Tax=Annulohypoxylon truncatum TaxID=327061 RepID=UPI0020089159|nr:uncharacterized protein F4807DRAFT_461036 [Annulohypoxylon truncatum]KAI1208912.1 hypothetical protein F4807DRAFT_461036 [Annulohypoxylon truncatum]
MGTVRASDAETSVSNAPLNASAAGPHSHPVAKVEQDQKFGATNLSYLEKLVVHTDPEILERGVTIGTKLLDQLKTALNGADTPEVNGWRTAIDELKERARPTRAVIGVVGDPGCGKSSLINAILKEEELVPADASPSMTITFSYNYSDDPTEKYRAEVQFIDRRELIDELRNLIINLSYEDEADSAYAMLKALYPNKTKEMMIKENAAELARVLPARKKLGKIIQLKADSDKSLSDRLRLYTDVSQTLDSSQGKLAYAPLVKEIRIYTKAEVLSTGAILADIPNAQDSNSAQVGQVEKYLKSCIGVWVVVPTSRVLQVGKVAPLLSDNFKRQLRYDGLQSAITLIISKTDDTHSTTFRPNLNTKKELLKLRSKLHKLENFKAKVESTLEDLRIRRRALKGRADEENSQSTEDRQQISKGGLERKLESLKSQERSIHDELQATNTQIDDVEKDLEKYETQRQHILDEMGEIGARGINEFKGHLRENLEQEFDAEIDKFDRENISEYGKISVEVAHPATFCVSSLAYRKLYGECEDHDLRSRGFLSARDTEIPQLQDHVRKITEIERVIDCQGYLNDLMRLVNSMKLWTLSNGSKTKLTDDEIRDELHLRKHLAHLEEEFKAAVNKFGGKLNGVFHTHIFRVFERAISSAYDAAPETVTHWGAPKNQGGLAWSTYRAVCRRNGYFRGATGTHDFNQELFQPISRMMLQEWNNTFQRHVPNLFRQFSSYTSKQLDIFAKATETQLQRRANVAEATTLLRQVSAHKRALDQLSMTWRRNIIQAQRDSHRTFIPTIRDAMIPAYRICAAERDNGCFGRMKEVMEDHITSARQTMFRLATDIVKGQLKDMCHAAMRDMAKKTGHMFVRISNEYVETLVGTNVGSYKELLPQDLIVRANVDGILHQCDSTFSLAFDKSKQTGDSNLTHDVEEKVDVAEEKVND